MARPGRRSSRGCGSSSPTSPPSASWRWQSPTSGAGARSCSAAGTRRCTRQSPNCWPGRGRPASSAPTLGLRTCSRWPTASPSPERTTSRSSFFCGSSGAARTPDPLPRYGVKQRRTRFLRSRLLLFTKMPTEPTVFGEVSCAPLLERFAASREVVGLVGVQLLRALARPATWLPDRGDGVHGLLQDLRVLDVDGGVRHRERDASSVDHNMALRSLFALVGRVRTGLSAPRGRPRSPSPKTPAPSRCGRGAAKRTKLSLLAVDSELDPLAEEAQVAGDPLGIPERLRVAPGDVLGTPATDLGRPVGGVALVGALRPGVAGDQ